MIKLDNYNNELSIFQYYDNFFNNEYYNDIYSWLSNQKFKSGHNKTKDKIDREQIWFEKNKSYFCKKWKERYPRWESEEYDNFLLDLQNKIRNHFLIDVNSCLINKYNNGGDYITPHKDNSISFGSQPDIIIYSLGCTRDMIIKNDSTDKIIKFSLKPNSILIMSGASQKNFTHEIPKDNSIDIRYSLTFRKYLKN